MNLGTFGDDTATLSALIEQRRELLKREYQQQVRDASIVETLDLMPLEEYVFTVKNRKSLVRDLETIRGEYPYTWKPPKNTSKAAHVLSPGQRYFLGGPGSMALTPDAAGWRAYLDERHAREIKAALAQHPNQASLLPEEGRQAHTLIIGPSRWGKSELLKALIHHYVEDGSAAVVVLDPLGDLAKDLARWPELICEDRLRLVQPGLDGSDRFSGYTVGINPFDVAALDVETRRKIADNWAVIFGELTAELTVNMRVLVSMCMQVLLSLPEPPTLADLHAILTPRQKLGRGVTAPPADPHAARLQEIGRNYEVKRVSDFFKNDFELDRYDPTRHSLRSRIEIILNLPFVESMMTGRPTINLWDDIEARRFIVVDLSRWSEDSAAMIGRLLVAQIAAVARRRESRPKDRRTPTHLIIDEASMIVSADMLKILTQLRKFGLYQTLAQQLAGHNMTPQQRDVLKINTGCKLLAPARQAEEWQTWPDNYQAPELKEREFLVQWLGVEGIHKLAVRSDLVRHAVPEHEYAAYLARITGPGGYYRPAAIARTVPEGAELDGLGDAEDQAPPPPRRSAKAKPAAPSKAEPAPLPDDVPQELADRFVSKTGRKSNF